jgi:hypothetical protein
VPNLTVLEPCDARKFAPAIVTVSPRWPLVGTADASDGGGITVNGQLFPGHVFCAPRTVTTTAPVAAPAGTFVAMLVLPHVVSAASTDAPPNLSVLVPCVEPKFVPATVTLQLTGPEAGLMDVICGGTGFGTIACESVVPSKSSSTLTLWFPEGW